MDDWTSEQALSDVLTGNWLAERQRVKAEEEAAYRESYNTWLDERAEADRMAHDAWLDELYAAEQLERAMKEADERRDDA